jgi:hypothetical protein
MVIVQLIGGLGNQLFQYALARRIAHMHNVPLKLDLYGFESYKLHKYSLQHFNIREDFASPDEIARFKNKSGVLARLATKFKPYYECSVVHERFFHFDSNMLKVSKNVYLEGYWQSEKYFKDIEDIIRREFIVKHKIDAENEQIAKHISSVRAISLHIRRGDYVSNTATNQIHGTCSLEYYHQAIDIIIKKVDKPYFFVFSDNSEWAKKNIIIDYPITFVDHNNADKNYEDMRLMSLCKHHIIANSSFSWWGAWLCTNPDKIIIAPRKWFNNQDINTTDLIPEKWIKI